MVQSIQATGYCKKKFINKDTWKKGNMYSVQNGLKFSTASICFRWHQFLSAFHQDSWHFLHLHYSVFPLLCHGLENWWNFAAAAHFVIFPPFLSDESFLDNYVEGKDNKTHLSKNKQRHTENRFSCSKNAFIPCQSNINQDWTSLFIHFS